MSTTECFGIGRKRIVYNKCGSIGVEATIKITNMILYKYCDENGLKILENLEIKITPPIDFNDPFEFSPTAKESFNEKWILNELKKKSVQNEIRIQFKREGYYNAHKSDFGKYIEDNKEFVVRFIMETYPKVQIWACHGLMDYYNNNYGIFCLSHTATNILMWSHYSKNHSGFVIEFDFGNNENIYKVNYSKSRVRIIPSIDNKKILDQGIFANIALTKSEDWSYEQEYRKIYDLNIARKANFNEKNIYLTNINPKIIKQIYLGVFCPKSLIAEVKNQLNKPELKHIKTEQMFLDHYNFKLRFESEFKTIEDKLFISMK
jgi:hypothetical protein